MIRKNSIRKTAKAAPRVAFVIPQEKIISCVDKPSYIAVCKILDAAGVDLFMDSDEKKLSIVEVIGKTANDDDYY